MQYMVYLFIWAQLFEGRLALNLKLKIWRSLLEAHSGTPRIPGSLSELLGVMSCMAIQAATWCLGI